MNKLITKTSSRKIFVAILTILLVVSIAMPLLSIVSAAVPTASLGTQSGPNGTAISVTGTGFGANEAVGAISVSVDGRAAGLNVITTSAVAVAGTNPAASIGASSQLATSATGALSGKIILYGLGVGSHTVIISDATTSVIAGQFTISSTIPSVTVTQSPVAAGTSVTVTGSGFPTAPTGVTYTNVIEAGSFAATAITVAVGVTTANPAQLSSNKLSNTGSYTATVSLPAIATGSAFTLRDAWGNLATTTLTITTPTVTLSPATGPVGTVVTATVTGFGPTSTIASVAVGNVVLTTSAAATTPAAPAVTEQGTSVFLFTMPAGTTTTKAGVAGVQTVTVTDSLNNVGTTTFTIAPKVTITVGDGTTDSGTTYVPQGATAAVSITASGFKANTVLTFVGSSAQIPSAWITPSSSWTPNTQVITNQLTTDANGQIATVLSTTGTAPAAIGPYVISLSDGTTPITTAINVVAAGNILAIPATQVSSGAAGQTGIFISYFGTFTPTGATLEGVSASPVALVAPAAWPTATTTTITVPALAPGVHTLALTGGAFNTVGFTILSSSVTVISPSSASVGTTVTVVGTGYANTALALAIQGGTVAGTANIIGNTLIATFMIPNYLPGTYTLSVADSANIATTTLTVASSSLQINPVTSTLGTVTIALTGSGFKAVDTITVTFDTTVITATTPVGLTVINTNGGMLINSGFVIPTATTAGPHTVTVTGATGAYATATFTVVSKLNSLAAVRPGAAVAITGTGFAANSLQTLTVNGTATTWLNVGTTPASTIVQSTVVTGATGNLFTTSSVGFVVSSTETSTALNITVTDASGYSASTILTILGTPAIKVGSTNLVAGTPIGSGVTINGTGFTPSSLRTTTPVSAQLLSGSTIVSPITLSAATVVVGDTGAFTNTAGLKFVVPAGVPAANYTLQFTIGTAGVSTPVETATIDVTVLGAPTLVAPTTARSGSNVTITVTGLTKVTDASISGVNLVVASVVQTVGAVNQFGAIAPPNAGANAYTLSTWFIVPTTLFAGSYLLTLADSNTGLIVQAAISVTPAITVTPATASKGATVTVATGTGFAATSTLTATVNGQAVTLSQTATDATGALAAATTFTVPLTAIANNTVVITDLAGNSASATFVLTVPTIQLNPLNGATGSTVTIIGSGFKATSGIVIQIGSIVATTAGSITSDASGAFIGFATVPAGLAGNVTVTAIDSSNNVGTNYFVVGGAVSPTVNTATMTTTAQTLNGAGTATTSFTQGSSVKVSWVLQSNSGSGDVVCAVTFQQGAQVYNIATAPAFMSTTGNTVSFQNLLPAGKTGTWTATLQVYATDGVTPLGVTTLTFTVS